MRSDSVGKETEVPMDDLFDIGVFAPGEGDGLRDPLYLQQHRISSGKQTIRITFGGNLAAPASTPTTS